MNPLFSQASIVQFLKYSVSGGFSFAIDLSLLFVLTEILFAPPLPSVAGAFVFATSIHYVINRLFVFRNNTRGILSGWILFLFFVTTAVLFVTAGVWLSTALFAVPVLVARVLVAPLAGLWSYYANARFNFRAL